MLRNTIAFVLILLFAVPVFSADSPISKGSMMVGGSAYFMIQDGDLFNMGYGDDRTKSITTFGLAPSVNYFISDGFLLGIRSSYAKRSQGQNNIKSYSIGPSLGLFLQTNDENSNIRGSHYPFVIFSALVGKADNQYVVDYGGGYGLSEYSTNSQLISLNIGDAYMLSEAVALDISLLLSQNRMKQESSDWSSGTTFQFGLGIITFLY